MLEPDEVKVSSPVLRGERDRKVPDLPDVRHDVVSMAVTAESKGDVTRCSTIDSLPERAGLVRVLCEASGTM
jgi:hypothetical protein